MDSCVDYMNCDIIWLANDCKLFKNGYYKFPETEQELNESAQGFAALSSHGAMKGCVACLDGYLLQIKVPAKAETGNFKAYFSGHYQTYGINMPAACDHQCRFVYAALAAPGGTNDIAAYRKKASMRWYKNCPSRSLLLGTMFTCALRLY